MKYTACLGVMLLISAPLYAKHKPVPAPVNNAAHTMFALNTDALKYADVILKTRAMLELGQTQCGPGATLTDKNIQLIKVGGDAAAKAISADQFSALDTAARANAAIVAKGDIFCLSVTSNKKSMLGAILNNAVKLGVGGDVVNPLAP